MQAAALEPRQVAERRERVNQRKLAEREREAKGEAEGEAEGEAKGEAEGEAEGVAASSSAPSKPRERQKGKQLPGGLMVQLCIRRGVMPGPESHEMMQMLQRAMARGLLLENQPHDYYLEALDEIIPSA
jgi:hypothetical protein